MQPISHLQMRGTFLVALSGMLYGVIGYLGSKLLHEHLAIPAMLFWRFFIAALWMLCSSFLLKKNFSWKKLNNINFLIIILFGAVTYSGGSAFYFIASQHIGTGLAMVIFFCFPMFVTLFAWILSDWRMNKYTFISLMAVIAGLFLLKDKGNTTLDLGSISFAVLAAFFYAGYVYGSQHTIKKMDSNVLTFLICLSNSIIFFAVVCYTKTFTFPVIWQAWLYIIAIGIVATALPIQLLLDGLKYISPIKASILSVLEPVMTVVVGLVLLHETLTITQAIGIIIVLLGAILVQFEKVSYQPEG